MSEKDKKDAVEETEVIEQLVDAKEPTPEVEEVKVEPVVPIEKKPEVVSLLEKARKEEKQKLYSTIEKLKQTVADATNDRENIETQLDDLKDKMDDKQNESLTEQEVLRKEMKKDASKNAQTIEKLTKNLEEFKVEARKKELELYRVQQIQLAGDDIVPSMVRGNTEEEIDTSVILAREEYKIIRGRVMSEESVRKSAVKTTSPVATSPPESQEEPIVPDMSKMDDKGYAEERDGIMSKIKNKFAEVAQN